MEAPPPDLTSALRERGSGFTAACVGVLVFVLLAAVVFHPTGAVAAGGRQVNATNTTGHANATNATTHANQTTTRRPNATAQRTWHPANPTSPIKAVTVSGPGVVNSSHGGVWLWRNTPVTFNVTFQPPKSAQYKTCVQVEQAANTSVSNESAKNCTMTPGAPNHTETASVHFKKFPTNASGKQNVTVVLRDGADNSTVYGRTKLHPSAMTRSGDLDKDGLKNAKEVKFGTNFTSPDTDGDGLSDGAEVHTYHTSPLKRDTNGDGIPDGVEVLLGINPTSRITPVLFPLVLVGGALAVGYLVWRFRHRFVGPMAGEADEGEPAGGQSQIDDHQPVEGYSVLETPDEQSLTDSERVIRIIRSHGGRVHQSDIVAETEWSKAKVSRLLTKMEENGQISKIRVGRENIITIDGSEPDWAT